MNFLIKTILDRTCHKCVLTLVVLQQPKHVEEEHENIAKAKCQGISDVLSEEGLWVKVHNEAAVVETLNLLSYSDNSGTDCIKYPHHLENKTDHSISKKVR